jgi:Outer membrane protein beta-barrel domain
MKKIKLILLFWIALMTIIQAQTAFDETDNHRHQKRVGFNTDFKSGLKIEAFIGASASFAYGSYIDYQKSFHGVAEAGSTINASIKPIFWGTAGVQARYNFLTDAPFDQLGISLGLQYIQKGFDNQFVSTYTSPENYVDVTTYIERYKLNYLAIPLQLRWGQKYFGSLGVSFNFHLWNTRYQKLTREQSGSGAIGGGFKTEVEATKSLLTTVINSSNVGFILGGGIQFNDKNALALHVDFGGKTLNSYLDNFKNITLQLTYLKNFQKE